ncbi:hypothetical protein GDO81_029643 [Engystomops pustulosus]|uniref:Uncharacterized protein n=1 Tax=Engystomops pustulosus TaxID=76066 RepID=A0AAV6YW66_ENGPU|nr:hypothetical protein GDO81_029643 [Engystomops pustulosus]
MLCTVCFKWHQSSVTFRVMHVYTLYVIDGWCISCCVILTSILVMAVRYSHTSCFGHVAESAALSFAMRPCGLDTVRDMVVK